MALTRPRWWSELTSYSPAGDLPASVDPDARGDRDSLGDQSRSFGASIPTDAGPAVRRVAERVENGLLAQITDIECDHVGVQAGADPDTPLLETPATAPSAVTRSSSYRVQTCVHVGLHHHGAQRDVDAAPRAQRARAAGPHADLADLIENAPAAVVTVLSRVPLRQVVRSSE